MFLRTVTRAAISRENRENRQNRPKFDMRLDHTAVSDAICSYELNIEILVSSGSGTETGNWFWLCIWYVAVLQRRLLVTYTIIQKSSMLCRSAICVKPFWIESRMRHVRKSTPFLAVIFGRYDTFSAAVLLWNILDLFETLVQDNCA